MSEHLVTRNICGLSGLLPQLGVVQQGLSKFDCAQLDKAEVGLGLVELLDYFILIGIYRVVL